MADKPRFFRVGTSVVLVTALFVLGCDSLFTSTLSGDVFIRTGAGTVNRQGGIEVHLFDGTIKSTHLQLVQELLERAEALARLDADVTRLRADVDGAKERALKPHLDQIAIEIVRLERPSAGYYWLSPTLHVVNNTSFPLLRIRYVLICDGDVVPSGMDENGHSLYFYDISRHLETDEYVGSLPPGKTFRSRYEETYFFPDSEPRKRYFKACPKEKLRATAVEFSGKDPSNTKSALSQWELLSPTEEMKRAYQALHDPMNQEREARKKGISDLQARWLDALAQNLLSTTRTSVDGHFNFEGLSRGHYVLAADYVTAIERDAWFVEVQVDDDTALDLTNSNLADPSLEKLWSSALATRDVE